MVLKNRTHRTPKGYNGTGLTTHHVSALLGQALTGIDHIQQQRPERALSAWKELMGPSVGAMTEAVSFQEGILLVRVKNSTLYSLLSQHDRPKIIKALKQKIPNLRNIHFRIG